MTAPALTVRILHQGKALVRAIEDLGTIAPSGPIERAAARVTEETLSPNERPGPGARSLTDRGLSMRPAVADTSRQDSWLQV